MLSCCGCGGDGGGGGGGGGGGADAAAAVAEGCSLGCRGQRMLLVVRTGK